MRIVALSIKNFRSLKDVTLSDLGNLVVIIGPNSSGKTNLMEALDWFFTGLNSEISSRIIGRLDDHIWFDRDHTKPIVFALILELSKEEIDTETIAPLIDLKDVNKIEITRVIKRSPRSTSWQTVRVVFNGKVLIDEGELKLRKEDAYLPLKLMTKVVLQFVSSSLRDVFRIRWAYSRPVEKIKKASQRRVEKSVTLGDREPMLNAETLSEIMALSQSIKKPEEDEWDFIWRGVKAIDTRIEDVRTVAKRIVLTERDNKMRVPANLVGGGNQEILDTLYFLREKKVIFGIEEPEAHLHPRMARQLFALIKDISQNSQIFLTTHSTIFVDMVDLTQTWTIKKDDKRTIFSRVNEPSDLKKLLLELGMKPSDVLFSNGLLFVEGKSDEIFASKMAGKMGLDFRGHTLSVIRTRGKDTGKFHLHLWIDVARNTNIPFFVILDKDAEKEAIDLCGKGILKKGDNLFLLEKGSIEDYYPDDKLIGAIRDLYGLDKEDEARVLERPRAKSVKKFLEQKGKYTVTWKCDVAEKVGDQITVDAIDNELKTIIEKIRTLLESHH